MWRFPRLKCHLRKWLRGYLESIEQNKPRGWFPKESGSPKTSALPSLKLTAKAPENGWLEYYFPFGKPYFQVLC